MTPARYKCARAEDRTATRHPVVSTTTLLFTLLDFAAPENLVVGALGAVILNHLKALSHIPTLLTQVFSALPSSVPPLSRNSPMVLLPHRRASRLRANGPAVEV